MNPFQETEPRTLATAPGFSAIVTLFGSMGKLYSSQLDLRPIITKSLTAGFIFALSDYLAQRIEKSTEEISFDTTRMIFAIMIGALYFGPAAHYWYEAIFRFLPGKGLVLTLQKASLGQVIFGPSFTCIFFASSLIQNAHFHLPTGEQRYEVICLVSGWLGRYFGHWWMSSATV